MSSTFNLSAKGRLTIGLTVSVLAASAISTARFVAAAGIITAFDFALIWPFALIWFSVARVRTARELMPVRYAVVLNPT